jgi:nicotinamidase-related amidase
MAAIDPANTVVLSMDFQNDVVTGFVTVAPELLARAGTLLDHARTAGIPVVHVVVQFRPGYPEVGAHGLFAMVRDSNRLVQGSSGAAIHDAVSPKDGDIIVTKKRVSAFAASDLECVLRASGRTHLVLLGIATSGVVLSTVRAAADLDYTMHVVSDCCADRDEDVHQFLIDRIFPRMAPAITAREFMDAVPAPN